MNYIYHLAILMSIYLPLVMSLRFIVVIAGLPLFSHAVFFGAGAYAYSIAVIKFGLDPIIGVFIGLIICIFLAVLIGSVCVKLEFDIFLVVTLSFQLAASELFRNSVELTNGPFGIAGVPSILAWNINNSLIWYLFVVLLFTIVVALLFIILEKRLIGLVLRAARDSFIYTCALGYDAAGLRITAFIICAPVAGLAGAFYAGYTSYIDPTIFTLTESILFYTIVLAGGEKLTGTVISALALLLIPEVLRFVGIPSSDADQIRNMIFGITLILIAFYRPQTIDARNSRV